MSGAAKTDVATIEVSLAIPHILLVDDDEGFLQRAREFFLARGYEVDSARTPELALQLLKKGEDKYQLIVTDIDFGDSSEVNGDRFILQDPSVFGRAKRMVVTGGTLSPDRRRELQNAGIRFLAKSPTLIEQLEDITEEEREKRVKETAGRIEELTGTAVTVRVVSVDRHRSASALTDLVTDHLKRTLVGWLRTRRDPDNPILFYGERLYSANEMAAEIPNETPTGLAHVEMLLREFECSLITHSDDPDDSAYPIR